MESRRHAKRRSAARQDWEAIGAGIAAALRRCPDEPLIAMACVALRFAERKAYATMDESRMAEAAAIAAEMEARR